MNRVEINGKTFTSVRSISISNGRVKIDGKSIEYGETDNGILGINIDGVVENISSDVSVTCGNVHGTVQAGGSVTCDNIGGDVQSGGSVTCDDVGGSIMAGGSVTHG